jgi:hypothetical protein
MHIRTSPACLHIRCWRRRGQTVRWAPSPCRGAAGGRAPSAGFLVRPAEPTAPGGRALPRESIDAEQPCPEAGNTHCLSKSKS